MEFEALVNAVASVGFPIVCVGYFAYYTQKLNELHSVETKELTERIHDLSLKIQQLIDRLDE